MSAEVIAEVPIDTIGDQYARMMLRDAVEIADRGEPVYLTDRGKRVARLVPEPADAAAGRCEW